MRHTEFWSRMTQALGDDAYAKHWADHQVMGSLGGRTAVQALADGWEPKEVWLAVHTTLGLPVSQR